MIRFIHPLAGNEQALGLDLRSLPGQREVVEQTIRDGRLTLAGPLELVEGGVGVIGRKPISAEGVGGEDPTFWGFVTIIIDFDELISGLDSMLGDSAM